MADEFRHGRAYSLYMIPNKDGAARDLHGATAAPITSSVDSTDEFVIGKADRCGVDKAIPEAGVAITQNERGEIGTYLTLANLDSEPVGGVTLLDFSSALIDYLAIERDEENGNVVATTWLPKTAISSLNLDIPDPESKIERSFELKGENKHVLDEDNRALIYVENTDSATTGAYVIDVTSFGIPSADPNNSGQYILRIDRTRTTAGVTTTETIDFTDDYTYNSGNEQITILAALPADVYHVYYSTDDYPSGQDPTTEDTADPCFLKADSVTVLISDGNTEVEIDVLSSLNISATINRLNEPRAIGSVERIKEISDTPVDVSLTGKVKDNTLLDAFMGKLDQVWGITDMNLYLDNVRITVKIYSDSTKGTFLIGYQVDELAFTDDSHDITANEFSELTVNSNATNLLITTVEANLT